MPTLPPAVNQHPRYRRRVLQPTHHHPPHHACHNLELLSPSFRHHSENVPNHAEILDPDLADLATYLTIALAHITDVHAHRSLGIVPRPSIQNIDEHLHRRYDDHLHAIGPTHDIDTLPVTVLLPIQYIDAVMTIAVPEHQPAIQGLPILFSRRRHDHPIQNLFLHQILMTHGAIGTTNVIHRHLPAPTDQRLHEIHHGQHHLQKHHLALPHLECQLGTAKTPKWMMAQCRLSNLNPTTLISMKCKLRPTTQHAFGASPSSMPHTPSPCVTI